MSKGTGTLYHPKYPPSGKSYAEARADGTLLESPTWWMAYYVDGRKVRESANTEKKSEAQRLLAIRTGAAAKGEPIAPRLDRIRYEEVRADLVAYYETSGDRDLTEAGKRLKHLDAYFAGRRLASIGPDDSTKYAAKRQQESAANGTINRELGVLGRMLSLACENNKLARIPIVRKLEEAAPRQGFFEHDQYDAVRKWLPEDLQCACAIMHIFGWRKGEVLGLERRQLDLAAGTLSLDPGTTKNDEGRTCYLTPELRSLLTAQVARVKALEKKLGRIIPVLFPHRGRQAAEPRHAPRRSGGRTDPRLSSGLGEGVQACRLPGDAQA